ncbi:MarR family winged helix-turn-helix transcriptional regulator [Couchioplanes caeruleus]|uniref:MarR family transcriptional regulator n=2 Tax=Couchioplanes caeruleus TaxID=56438 RepID=A0A1K0FYW2_9ACTN|nr:MarR family transcriptional regulator [Couchioplanes caeruleus]OJF10242.1 MarR family transcriptional regulator [Couchioplanes caeruleus subsp. caeruleus]ROP29381.1 DNA-binding MarR family transcriptional regulator [Couchioplanes caeruleus]
MAEDEAALSVIETQVAMIVRLGEATRRSSPRPHRALDRAAYVILRLLQEAGPQNVSAVAHRLNLDGSTVTRQVGAMHRDGLVERSPDPEDGRGTVIAATVRGLAQVDAVSQARRELYDTVLRDWTPHERKELAAVLERLTRDMDTYIKGRGTA